MAYNIFTDEQLYLIRDIFGDVCANHVERGDIDCAKEELEIINAIQRHFDDTEYVNTEHFVQEDGGSWSDIPDYKPVNNIIAMNEKPRNLATYKEFSKMLQEVANIYSQMGDTPLEEEGWEREDISNAIYFITNKHDFQDFIRPWKDAFLRNPIDVTEAKRWAAYVKNCREKGIPCNYQEYQGYTENEQHELKG